MVKVGLGDGAEPKLSVIWKRPGHFAHSGVCASSLNLIKRECCVPLALQRDPRASPKGSGQDVQLLASLLALPAWQLSFTQDLNSVT